MIKSGSILACPRCCSKGKRVSRSCLGHKWPAHDELICECLRPRYTVPKLILDGHPDMKFWNCIYSLFIIYIYKIYIYIVLFISIFGCPSAVNLGTVWYQHLRLNGFVGQVSIRFNAEIFNWSQQNRSSLIVIQKENIPMVINKTVASTQKLLKRFICGMKRNQSSSHV